MDMRLNTQNLTKLKLAGGLHELIQKIAFEKVYIINQEFILKKTKT